MTIPRMTVPILYDQHGPYEALVRAALALVNCERDEEGIPAHMLEHLAMLADLALALADVEPTRPAPLD